MLRKSIRTKMKRLLPGPRLELSTFKDTLKFSSWQLIYLIVNACCKLMLELVLEMLFCAFFFLFASLVVTIKVLKVYVAMNLRINV